MTLQAQLNAEIAARIKADAALDARLTKLETPIPVPVPPPTGGLPPLESLTKITLPLAPLPALRVPTTIGDRTYQRIGAAGQRHAYATIQPWSKDMKYLHLHYGGHALLDGRTFAAIKTISPPDRAQWSTQDPDVIYGEAGTKIVAYNVVTGVTTTIKDFGRTISLGNGEGAISDNGVLPVMDFAGNACSFDTTTGIASPWIAMGHTPDNLKISHDGKVLIGVHEGNPLGTMAYYVDGSQTPRQLRSYANHADTVAYQGRQYLVTVSPSVDRIDLETGATIRLLDSPNAFEAGHISGRVPGTALLSTYSGYAGRPGDHQVVSVSLDGSKQVRRYGFDFCTGSPYEHEPHGVLSPDGTKALVASDWFGGSYYPLVLGV